MSERDVPEAQDVPASAPNVQSAVRGVLAQVWQLRQAGRAEQGREVLMQLRAMEGAAEVAPVWRARVSAALAECELEVNEYAAAADHLSEAVRWSEGATHEEAVDWCMLLSRELETQRELSEALRVAELGMQRARAWAKAEPETQAAFAEMAWSLRRTGRLALVLGHSADARDEVEESLRVSREMLALWGEEPKTLRDLSMSLDSAGEVRRARGELSGAEAAFAESLVLRRLLELRGEAPGALRDLSVSLNQVGSARRERGELPGAEAAFAESLSLARRLLELRGEVPEALRDLLLTLHHLALTHTGAARPELAAPLLDEARALAARLDAMKAAGLHVDPFPELASLLAYPDPPLPQ